MTTTFATQPKNFDFDSYTEITRGFCMPYVTSPDFLAGYSLRGESDIRDFLRKHPTLIEYVREAPTQIRKYFKNAHLSVEISIDPEVDCDQGVLFVNIDTDEEVHKAWVKLNKLTDEWLIPVAGRDLDRFNINLDYA